MLPTFNLLAGSVLALAFLFLAIAGPFALAWVLLSIRRDIHIIAEAQKQFAQMNAVAPATSLDELAGLLEVKTGRVANSALGR